LSQPARRHLHAVVRRGHSWRLLRLLHFLCTLRDLRLQLLKVLPDLGLPERSSFLHDLGQRVYELLACWSAVEGHELLDLSLTKCVDVQFGVIVTERIPGHV